MKNKVKTNKFRKNIQNIENMLVQPAAGAEKSHMVLPAMQKPIQRDKMSRVLRQCMKLNMLTDRISKNRPLFFFTLLFFKLYIF